MNILLADDEKPLLNFLERGLKAEGYLCHKIDNLHEVLPYIKKNTPDLVILDRLFGSEDSLTIIDSIKSLPSSPMILMLTALDEVGERVQGLKEGADDYLCKPFDFDELLARITALSRRKDQPSDQNKNILSIGKLTIKLDERMAHLNDKEVSLTKIEYDLLLYLAENQMKVLSRERIISRVWQSHADPQTNIVDVYISRLRRRLESDPEIAIQTLRGNGYRFGLISNLNQSID